MKTVVLLIALFAAAAAVPRNPQRIVGGYPVTIYEHGYFGNMEYLVWNIIWSQSCGCTLLTSRSFLTAAHCLFGDHHSQWRVRWATSFLSGGTVTNLAGMILHPQYSHNTLDNDVAVGFLTTSLSLGNIITTARIAGNNYRLPVHTEVSHIGFGDDRQGGSGPNQLHRVEVNIIDHDLCAVRYAYLKTLPGFQNWPDITDGMVCSGVLNVGGRDACQGDSGGPLLHAGDVVYGVTSWGYDCAHDHYPGVCARVSTYSDWIVATAST